MSKKSLDALREKYTEILMSLLEQAGEETLRTGSGKVAIPVLDNEGEEAYVTFTVAIPSGSRDGTPYDGYEERDAYALKLKQNAEKAERRAQQKAKKIARDQKMRAEKARLKEKREKDA